MNTSLFPRARGHSALPHRRSQPLFDALEDRILLNARYIVPFGVLVDNTSTFATLQAALTTPGLALGDTIQIEPGSSPGIVTITTPPVANLTIQGDPAVEAASIPQFLLSTSLVVNPAESGFTLKNINMGLIQNGTDNGGLSGTGNININNSLITVISSQAADDIIFGGITNTLTNSTIVAAGPVAGYLLQLTTPAGGSNNLISRNTFVLNAQPVAGAILYFSGSAAAVTDEIVANTFSDSLNQTTLKFFIFLGENLSGLTISSNTFSDPGYAVAIGVRGGQNLTISNNTMNLGTNSTGISLDTTGALAPINAVIFNNHITARGISTIGVGIRAGASYPITAKVSGNDIHTVMGIFLTGPVAGVDLGGGSQGSLGGNDLRSISATPSTLAGAIVCNGATGSVSAESNMFTPGAAISSLVYDPTAILNVSTPLTGNAAFVQTLYEEFLQRPGETTNPADAGYWINALNTQTMTTAQVAAGITHSTEALGLLVNGLYARFLGRLPDSAGLVYYLTVLQAPGQGVESMIRQLVTSPEYTQQFAADGNFVQSLYARLLGRVAAPADVTFWLGILASSGRTAVVNSILASAEFRTDVVQQFYGFAPALAVSAAAIFLPVFHRVIAPGAAEINFWVSSSQDALSLETSFTQTPEFFNFG